MNIDDERIFASARFQVDGASGHTQRFGEKGFDFESIVVTEEGEGFDFGDLLALQNFGVEIGEFLGSAACRLEEELRSVAR